MDKLITMRKQFFVFLVCLNISILFYYKYLSFIMAEILKKDNIVNNKIMPIGISFYTFSILSYIIEVYKKNEKPIRNIIDMGLYVSFFPKLTQGPIVKYKDFVFQLSDRMITTDKIYYGITRFIVGLGKKILIANVFGEVVDEIFGLAENQLSTGVAWFGAVGYTLQIYFDFSGYSDMAIGLGKMFGFDFKENFNYPYLSISVRDFWRRWHISLNSWFRDYIYIPLGGNRNGRIKTYINTMVVFVMTGIWHGANWTFWIWGIFHGLISIAESCFLGRYLKKAKIINVVYTDLVVIFGWVFFRADSINYAFSFIKNMIIYKAGMPNLRIGRYANKKIIIVFILGIVFSGIIQCIKKRLDCYIKLPNIFTEIGKVILLIIVFLLSLMTLASGTYNAFIYFQF